MKENEPDVFAKIDKIMLPGDYIAMRLSGGDKKTTVSGLSEGIFWDFKNNEVSKDVLNYFGFSENLIAEIVPTFSVQSTVCQAIADELGIPVGTPIANEIKTVAIMIKMFIINTPLSYLIFNVRIKYIYVFVKYIFSYLLYFNFIIANCQVI